MGDAHMGLQARLMSQALRKLTATIGKSRTILVFINQIRMKIGMMFGNPETTTGGNALKFYASVRLEVRRTETIEASKDDAIGNRVRVKVVKNKVAPPFKKAELEIMFGKGVSAIGSILDAAVKYEVVDKKGAWFTYGEEKIGQGRENAKQYLSDNPNTTAEIEQKLKKIMFPDRVLPAPKPFPQARPAAPVEQPVPAQPAAPEQASRQAGPVQDAPAVPSREAEPAAPPAAAVQPIPGSDAGLHRGPGRPRKIPSPETLGNDLF
jgi:recombination protein RecA